MAATIQFSRLRPAVVSLSKSTHSSKIKDTMQHRLLGAFCRCGSRARPYYTYDNTQTTENQKFLYQWNLLRHKLGPSPLKESPWPRQEWQPGSRRCGLLAVKLGMFPMWTKTGKMFPTTALQVQECNVIQYLPPGAEGTRGDFAAIEVGAKNASPIYRDKDYFNKFDDACVPVKQRTASFAVTENAVLQPGTPLYATHFRPGMYVDCCGRTIGKGFQGVMKRWGMKGQPASHGQTKTHRRMGATGGSTLAIFSENLEELHSEFMTGISGSYRFLKNPGRIWKGKKMPGPMGNKWRWTRCLKIWRINTRHNIIFVHGNISGSKGGFVRVKDSLSGIFKESPAPFPTHYPEDGEDVPEDLYDEDVHQMADGSIEFEVEEEEI